MQSSARIDTQTSVYMQSSARINTKSSYSIQYLAGAYTKLSFLFHTRQRTLPFFYLSSQNPKTSKVLFAKCNALTYYFYLPRWNLLGFKLFCWLYFFFCLFSCFVILILTFCFHSVFSLPCLKYRQLRKLASLGEFFIIRFGLFGISFIKKCP